jgi:hypothetical protein
MSANPDSDPDTDADSQTPRNAVEDLQGLLLRLQMPQMYTEPSVVQTDICLDLEKLGAEDSPEETVKMLDDLSTIFSRLGWLFNEDTGLIDLSLPCFEIGYMLKPVYLDRRTIKPLNITLKMNFLLKQLQYFHLNVKKQNTTLRQIIQYAVNGIAEWKKIQSKPQTATNQAAPSPNPMQPNNNQQYNSTLFGRGWIAWSDLQHPNSIIYTKDNFHFYRDSMSNWIYYKAPNFAYFQHKNAGPNRDQSNDCYVHVASRQFTQGQIVYDMI